MKSIYKLVLIIACIGLSHAKAQSGSGHTTPMMGWSSWNNFGPDINEKIIKEETDALIKLGLKDAGYSFINIDDGFFESRDKDGNLQYDKSKFPDGMKELADYIHGKGMKAGIYTDAGINTCASIWHHDSINSGSGMYGHDEQDLNLFLKKWGYDFLKVDWCGGLNLKLDDQLRYTQISMQMAKINPNALLNICRQKFPGKWAPLVAGSWRVSDDIGSNFNSILGILTKNVDLWKYCSLGHFNDMDMLQVGRGMTYEEDKTHFSMWCMLNSPLILGNDLRHISKETLSIITNKEIIALNQDNLCYQARRIAMEDRVQIWAKPLVSAVSGEVAVALLNTDDKTSTVTLNIDSIGIDTKDKYTIRDLWKHTDLLSSENATQKFEIPPHGTLVLKITGKSIPFNVFEKG